MIYKAIKGRSYYGAGIGIILMDIYMPFPPGTPGNATSFPYPVTYSVVKGATHHQMKNPTDSNLVKAFVEAGNNLVNQGVKGITGNCGFMVYYQDILCHQ